MSTMAVTNSHGPDGRVTKKAPERVTSTTKVNVAFPFSQVKIQEPSEHLVALTELVADLAGLVAEAAPGQEAERLKQRARDLAGKLS
jgi:hypothetical protein